jgi:hypothetical protein
MSNYATTVTLAAFNSVFCFVAAYGAFLYIQSTNPTGEKEDSSSSESSTDA